MFQTEVVEKIKIHILCSIPFVENVAVHVIMWKNMVGTEQATDDSMAHEHCILHS